MCPACKRRALSLVTHLIRYHGLDRCRMEAINSIYESVFG